MCKFTEATYEEAIIKLFENMGYEYIYAPDYDRYYTCPFLEDILKDSLVRINRDLPMEAIDDALSKLKNFDTGSLLQKNMIFMDYLQNGITVKFFVKGEEQSSIVRLIDYKNVNNNSFYVVNQFMFIDNGNPHRPDVILFINGLPLVLIELKSPIRDEVDAGNAYRQIRNYMQDIPTLFYYNAICVISDMVTNKAGTITSGLDRFMEWKTKDGNYEDTTYASFETFYEGIFQKERLLDIFKNFILFSGVSNSRFKVLAGYHQYFAVRKAIERAKIATKTDGKGGVFWHTQGSGKSLSMVFYAHLLQEALDSPTIVVMTDRIDLDDQLYAQFSQCAEFLRQTPVQAESKEHLKSLLDGRSANGIIFTTMFKFERGEKPLSERRNIVVMADEAHRGQYGFDEKIVMSENEYGEKEAHTVIGNARIIHDALPNATFIGFTGTPISSKDRNTREVFGEYIDVYDMTQAVEDGATRPVYYESRVVHLKLDEHTLGLIDSTYDVLEQQSDKETIEKSKKMLGQMESVLGADSTIESLCDDIIEHYEKHRANLLTGKAMIVAYSRTIAMKIYRCILEKRPTWTDKVGVVMTGGNNDPADWKKIIGTKAYKEELARKFKDNDDPMKIAIVVDMWLTGFDVPSLATMYVYKPMRGYNLMQAIARVNRVFKDKEGGLIVDYVGIASALKNAMKEYTKRDQSTYGDMNIAKMAYPKFQEKLQVCKDLLHGFDFSGFIGGTPLTMAKLITGGVNYILDASAPERKELFLKESMLLKQSSSLCSSMTTEQERHESAYMEALRSTIVKITYGGSDGKTLSLTEINAQINELLKAAVQSEGVISLFDSSKSGGEKFSLFDPAALEEISQMKEKNIAVEILRKLMAEQVSLYKRTNVVQSKKFSEKIAQLMNSYYNGLITNEEVIKELLETAEEIANLYKSGQELGLSQEELAFYDALTKPEHIKDFYKNDELIALTRELTEMLRKNRTIDWQKKETARAQMRKMVKRLLKKYKYPPEDYAFAISTVISQCELWTDYVEPRKEEKIYKYVSEVELSKVAEEKVPYNETK
ncbi:type I restriction endonuclease subunit R [Enterococcus cecorum]|uniref:type I restriction endonuclease subunit R n=1 Tax=Enterococcus cecorum TaxID=44008 RepID=UPI003F8D83D0